MKAANLNWQIISNLKKMFNLIQVLAFPCFLFLENVLALCSFIVMIISLKLKKILLKGIATISYSINQNSDDPECTRPNLIFL